MHKICVVGCSGGGKTTFAASLAQRLGLPHLELDSIYHQSEWRSLPTQEFRARVEEFTSQRRWVVDGNYISDVGDITWGGADSIVWLDTSRLVATGRVVRRTLGRLFRNKELWNGNRERWRQVLSRDPETSIVMWSWKMHEKYTDRYEAAIDDPRWRHLRFVRLRTPREAEAFLESLTEPKESASNSEDVRAR